MIDINRTALTLMIWPYWLQIYNILKHRKNYTSVYIVSRLTIHDRSEYDKYENGFAEVFEKYDGKMLSVDEEPTVLTGEWEATRSVIIEFPSKRSAVTWLMSDEYQEISKHREAGSTQAQYWLRGLNS